MSDETQLGDHYNVHMMVRTRFLSVLTSSTLDINGTHDTVSIDHLKPAYFESSSSASTHSNAEVSTHTPVSFQPPPTCTTRSGRRVKFLQRLNL